jgi:hypothetical protein
MDRSIGCVFRALIRAFVFWLLSPASQIKSIQRRYRKGTLVLETDYETEDGAVTLVDCRPPRSKQSDMVRLIVGRRGQVRMRMQLIIRFDYGSIIPWVRGTHNGIRAIAGAGYSGAANERCSSERGISHHG